MNTKFWPENVTLPKSSSERYFKPQEGENRIRVLGQPIFGWIDWLDKKPLRFRYDKKPDRPAVEARPVKMFVTFSVWDYATKSVKVYEIQQSSIQKVIHDLSFDKEWGDPRNYDIKIIKKGVMKDTEYVVTPCPPKPLAAEIKAAYESTPLNLENLFEGMDPFTNMAYSDLDIPSDDQIFIDMIQEDTLDAMIVADPSPEEATKKILTVLNISELNQMKKPDYEKMTQWLQSRAGNTKKAGKHV